MCFTALHNVAKIMFAKLSYKDMESGDLLRDASLSDSSKLEDLTTETNRCVQSRALGKGFTIYNQTRNWVKWMFFPGRQDEEEIFLGELTKLNQGEALQ